MGEARHPASPGRRAIGHRRLAELHGARAALSGGVPHTIHASEVLSLTVHLAGFHLRLTLALMDAGVLIMLPCGWCISAA